MVYVSVFCWQAGEVGESILPMQKRIRRLESHSLDESQYSFVSSMCFWGHRITRRSVAVFNVKRCVIPSKELMSNARHKQNVVGLNIHYYSASLQYQPL